jgi:NADH-quinone oxidoreductase subunit C
VTSETARTFIAERFGVVVSGAPGDLTTTVPVDRWLELAACAHGTLGCRFFSFSTAVDLKDEGLEVVARVENLDVPFALTMKTRLGPGVTRCSSLVGLYRGANWMERECYDMFGITFADHPDLRRILLPDDWQGHPLLKSYDVDTPYPPYR